MSYAEWRKPISEDHILYDSFICFWNDKIMENYRELLAVVRIRDGGRECVWLWGTALSFCDGTVLCLHCGSYRNLRVTQLHGWHTRGDLKVVTPEHSLWTVQSPGLDTELQWPVTIKARWGEGPQDLSE